MLRYHITGRDRYILNNFLPVDSDQPLSGMVFYLKWVLISTILE